MPSSVVSSISYDPASFTLRVIFISGMIYDYKKVSRKTYEAMKKASSKGKYLNKYIKEYYALEKIK